jgi:hypothetical protein
MKKKYLSLTLLIVSMTLGVTAQTRYVDAIYTDAQIEVTSDVDYATNIDFLRSNVSNQMNVGRDITEIKTALAMSQPIPVKFFNADTTVDLKVTTIRMDVYKPMTSEDPTTDRPVIVYLHTGNFLPPGINGSPNGQKTDSSAIVLCTEWAKRGYVAVSVNYRLGWNPIATDVEVRRGQLLNAVYRAIHDVKVAVRTLKDGAATYGIDPNKVVLYGEGTGAYVALAYETLDKNEEMELAKFRAGGVGNSYINRAVVGEIDGSGGVLNLYTASMTSTEVAAIVTAGGALADTSWLEAGDAPMIAFHSVRDAFAPFNEGTVIVPTTNEDVVDVQGANLYIQKANKVGNNDAIKDIEAYDPYTIAAEAHYGATVPYIYDDETEITINSDVKGLFPVLLPIAAEVLNNQASPWQWWSPTSALATLVVGPAGSGFTAHMNSLRSNPDMSPEKGRTYIDTIMGYMCPRIALINGDIELSLLNTKEVLPSNAASVYPNPATSEVTVSIDTRYTVKAINVIDITGRVVLTANASSTATLDLNGLQSGYYFVNVSTDQGMVSTKLIKE